jgi:TolB protein
MKIKHLALGGALLWPFGNGAVAGGPPDSVHFAAEVHLKNVRQLTFGGDNAEAYFSSDSRRIVFQATNDAWGAACDQIYTFTLADGNMQDAVPSMASTGLGRTTCAYFLPGNSHILYATTQFGDSACPPVPPHRPDHKYVWPVYSSYDIVTADLDGHITGRLAESPGYDAEATVSPKGDRIVFTSLRSGDLELYTMKVDGTDIRQITDQLGYDGGAFFSPDGSKIVFRASRPGTPEEVEEYRSLLAEGLVMPTEMEIYVCDADGSNLKQVTHLGGANWAPFFTPDGRRIIFSSNHKTKGFHFNLYLVNLDGTGLTQVTHDPKFDAFPMFSPDGTKLIWSSNRNNGGTYDTNLFIADWVE